MTKSEVIDRIRYFRFIKRLSARELSMRLGKHDTYISKMEITQFNLTLEIFLAILKELDVPVQEFFAETLSFR